MKSRLLPPGCRTLVPLILLAALAVSGAESGSFSGEFTGIRWRTDLDLKVNCLWLEHYGYDSGDPTKQYWKEHQTVWFDDVVVVTSYIGPRVD